MNFEQPPRPGEPHQPPSPNTPSPQPETEPQPRPRIWVGSRTDYQHGLLHGNWLDAARSAPDVEQDVELLLATSPWANLTGTPADQWDIFDYTDFGVFRPTECLDVSWISTVARGIHQHGLPFSAWANYVDGPDDLPGFDAAYLGHYDSLHAYLEQLVNDLGYDRVLDDVIPPSIRPWVKIDLDGTARDLEHGGDIFTEQANTGGVWIFNAH